MLATRGMPDNRSSPGLDKRQINFRLSRLARGMLARLALARGVSQTDIVEMLIREEADRRGIVVRDPPS